MGLKHWILPNNQFKTHLFFSIFGWGGPFSAWILVGRVAQTSKLSGEAIWQVSEDPYHTEFVSWHVDHFWFFRIKNYWKIPIFFFEPFPYLQGESTSSFLGSYPFLGSSSWWGHLYFFACRNSCSCLPFWVIFIICHDFVGCLHFSDHPFWNIFCGGSSFFGDPRHYLDHLHVWCRFQFSGCHYFNFVKITVPINVTINVTITHLM